MILIVGNIGRDPSVREYHPSAFSSMPTLASTRHRAMLSGDNQVLSSFAG
ncbi:uncharacterized protein METZ01_LOCUS253112 [marine metagenome]|uniref:Uncharacterized protein n=1 Tax=marine metagenome TaxID=408172 RepID=A0A382IL05_9ZZZZ